MEIQDVINSKDFLSRVEKTSYCWNWTGPISNTYGALTVRKPFKKFFRAHRVSYELFKGKIPNGLHVHHLCENRICVNPDHIDIISQSEHNRIHKTKTHCHRGHLLDGENLYFQANGRSCRTCRNQNARNYYERYIK